MRKINLNLGYNIIPETYYSKLELVLHNKSMERLNPPSFSFGGIAKDNNFYNLWQ